MELAMRSLASWTGIAGGAASILAAVLGGLQFSDYSHLSQYLSEAYAVGTPHGFALRYLLYVPSGILIAVFAVLASRLVPRHRLISLGFLGIAIFYAVPAVVGSTFPCDAGCNRELIAPSWSHLVHLASGAVAHIMAPICLLLIGFAARRSTKGKPIQFASLAAANTCFACNLVLSLDPVSAYAGLFQRLFEGSVLCWIVFIAFHLRQGSAMQHDSWTMRIGGVVDQLPRRLKLRKETQGSTRCPTRLPSLRRAA
jgi:hypothetical protein